MTTTSDDFSLRSPRVAPMVQGRAGLRFDWLWTLLSLFFVFGLFIDGWAHNHGRVDESFFTPWHAVFYSGFLLIALALLRQMALNRRGGHRGLQAIPAGYSGAALGVLIFAGGGAGDLIWHTLFGIEENTEALLSPTHMLLVIGMVLICSGPFRAAWLRREASRGWSSLFPVILSTTLFLSVLSFITMFSHPMVEAMAVFDVPRGEMSGDIFVMGADGGSQTRLTASPVVFDTHPTFSPDGGQILYAAETEAGYELFRMQADGSGLQQLTAQGVRNWNPAWSPDGSQVAFSSLDEGNSEIMLMNADGTGLRQLTGEPGQDWGPRWSPDAARLSFTSDRDGWLDVYLLELSSGEVTRLTDDPQEDWGAVWSPDGSQLAFVSQRSGVSQIYSLDLSTRELRAITSGDYAAWSPAWSQDGGQIAFTSDQSGDDEIYTIRPDGSGLANLTNNPSLNEGFPDWSPDGSRLVYRAQGVQTDFVAEIAQAFGVSTIILQSALLVGVLLLLLRRWQPPFGTFTLILSLNAVGMSFMDDEFRLVPAAILAGLCADLLYRVLRPGYGQARSLGLFAFLVPFIYTGLYFATLFLTDTVLWSIHFWAGAIFISGLVGFLLSLLVQPTALPEAALPASG